MDKLTDISYIQLLFNQFHFDFSKSLGQNFLIDPFVCPHMAELCGVDCESGVLEIGPGIGVLTRELAQRAKKVVAVEYDTRLLPILAKTLSGFDNIEIVSGDVMKLDLKSLLTEKFAGMKAFVCANLPYYITSPVIMRLLEERLPLEAVTVMVQNEAAERLCSSVGTRKAGASTVAVNYYSVAKRLFDVSAESFMPSPEVDSAVMRLDIRESPEYPVKSEKFFFSVVRAAFCQRRKTMLNGVSGGMGFDKVLVAKAIADAGLQDRVRAEALTMGELSHFADTLYELTANSVE